MIEFSRQHQEHRLHEEQEEGIRQLTEEEVNLEEKLEKLFELDRELQEQSYTVTSLQEDRVRHHRDWGDIRVLSVSLSMGLASRRKL